jgi:two-component system NarL family sensor kinase
LTQTVNGLLDSLAQERQRIQDLGVEVVRAHDIERAKVSRELHDSIAQNLAAVRFQIAAASNETRPEEIKNGLAAVNAMISAAVEEIVNVSTALHSRVAEDLGLEVALDALARQIERRSGINVRIAVSQAAKSIPAPVASTLFRVAEEALRELEMQRNGNSATVRVDAGDGIVRLELDHDGYQPARPELTLIKDRVTLAGGSMTIEKRNGGTRVTAELKQLKVAS